MRGRWAKRTLPEFTLRILPGRDRVLNLALGQCDNEPVLNTGAISCGSWSNAIPATVFCCPEPESVDGTICINGSIPGHVLNVNEEMVLLRQVRNNRENLPTDSSNP